MFLYVCLNFYKLNDQRKWIYFTTAYFVLKALYCGQTRLLDYSDYDNRSGLIALKIPLYWIIKDLFSQ